MDCRYPNLKEFIKAQRTKEQELEEYAQNLAERCKEGKQQGVRKNKEMHDRFVTLEKQHQARCVEVNGLIKAQSIKTQSIKDQILKYRKEFQEIEDSHDQKIKHMHALVHEMQNKLEDHLDIKFKDIEEIMSFKVRTSKREVDELIELKDKVFTEQVQNLKDKNHKLHLMMLDTKMAGKQGTIRQATKEGGQSRNKSKLKMTTILHSKSHQLRVDGDENEEDDLLVSVPRKARGQVVHSYTKGVSDDESEQPEESSEVLSEKLTPTLVEQEATKPQNSVIQVKKMSTIRNVAVGPAALAR